MKIPETISLLCIAEIHLAFLTDIVALQLALLATLTLVTFHRKVEVPILSDFWLWHRLECLFLGTRGRCGIGEGWAATLSAIAGIQLDEERSNPRLELPLVQDISLWHPKKFTSTTV